MTIRKKEWKQKECKWSKYIYINWISISDRGNANNHKDNIPKRWTNFFFFFGQEDGQTLVFLVMPSYGDNIEQRETLIPCWWHCISKAFFLYIS